MLRLQSVQAKDRDLLWNINQKYLYEMTSYYDDPMDENDNYHYGHFDDYFHHLIVCEVEGKIASSCVCVIIPNLTRNVRPYAFVENVVTHADYRGKGYATECLDFAKKIAEQENCYKMMLLTGSKSPETLRFYEKAGYNSSDKTAFIQWIGMDK